MHGVMEITGLGLQSGAPCKYSGMTKCRHRWWIDKTMRGHHHQHQQRSITCLCYVMTGQQAVLARPRHRVTAVETGLQYIAGITAIDLTSTRCVFIM